MKTNQILSFLFLLITSLLHKSTWSQNIRNDTIFVSSESVIQIIFPSPGNVSLPGGDGSYEVSGAGNKGLAMKALKKGVRDQPLIVTEGSRTHQLILSYKEGVPAKIIDWSTKGKIKDHLKEKKDALTRGLNEANNLYIQKLWKEALKKYQRLSYDVEPNSKEAAIINSRLNEIGKLSLETDLKNYKAAMDRGNSYLPFKKYDEAWMFFTEALKYKPNDLLALKQIAATDTLRFEDKCRKGDSAFHDKDFSKAVSYYKQAAQIDSLKFRPWADRLSQSLNEAEYYNILAKAKNYADTASTFEGYNLAIDEYTKAANLFKDRNFPKDKIKALIKARDKLKKSGKNSRKA